MSDSALRRILVALVGYAIIAVFAATFVIVYVASNLTHDSLGWPALSTSAILVIAALVAAPPALAFVWDRLTTVKVFQFEISLKEVTTEVSFALPHELKDEERLAIGPSATPNLVEKIETAIKAADKTGVVEVDIGVGRSWWSTRLYLLAALAADFTDIRQILFFQTAKGLERSFIGHATPEALRRLLAADYSNYKEAYTAAKANPAPEPDASIPERRVAWIATGFVAQLNGQGGEGTIKEWVTGEFLDRYAEVLKDGIEWNAGPAPAWLLHTIINRPEHFVALVGHNGQLERVVDRLKLAERIAKASLRQQLP